MIGEHRTNWSLSRRFVSWTAAALAALVGTHALAGALHLLFEGPAPSAALLSVAVLVTTAAGAIALPRGTAVWIPAALGLGGVALLELARPESWAPAIALPLVGSLALAAARRLGRRLPASLDDVWNRRRGVALLWVAMSLLSVAQIGRLSTRMSDWDSNFVLTTQNPFWHTHQCMSAYLYAAELSERGDDNLYDAKHYPALDRDAAPQSKIANMVVEDPYQYPPQFLLVPRLALAITRDFEAIRVVWFALQLTLFVAVYAWLALWIGGRTGSVALWLLPATLGAFPTLHALQFGQVHLAVVAISVGAMLAFQTGRGSLGGLMLASATLAKLFPGLLLLPLLFGRRYRELAWTAGWAVAITLIALVVLGPQPFVAFVQYQMPRLGDGRAFAFEQAWPELGQLVIADNQGVFGLARKFGADAFVAAWASRVFTLLLAALAVWIGGRALRGSNAAQGTIWLALIGLGTLSSPGAWGDYVPVTAIWLLAFVAARALADARLRLPLLAVAFLQYTLLGTMPIGNWEPYGLMIPVSALGALSMLALFTASAVAPMLATSPERATWISRRQTVMG